MVAPIIGRSIIVLHAGNNTRTPLLVHFLLYRIGYYETQTQTQTRWVLNRNNFSISNVRAFRVYATTSCNNCIHTHTTNRSEIVIPKGIEGYYHVGLFAEQWSMCCVCVRMAQSTDIDRPDRKSSISADPRSNTVSVPATKGNESLDVTYRTQR